MSLSELIAKMRAAPGAWPQVAAMLASGEITPAELLARIKTDQGDAIRKVAGHARPFIGPSVSAYYQPRRGVP